MFRAVLSEAPNSCQLYTQEWYRPPGISDRRSQYATARSLAAFAFSKHHTNYTQLRSEVLILPAKLKETLTVNYVFTWDFCWVLNVNLHVQITCRLTALHVTQFGFTNKCLRSFSPQHATFFCTTASYTGERNEQATFLPYHFPPEERKLVTSRRAITHTMGGQHTSVARYRCVK